MNIENEITDLEQGKSTSLIFEHLQEQREELNKKIYFFQIITLMQGIKDLIKSDSFKKNDIAAIEITHHTHDKTNHNYFTYELYTLDGKLLQDIHKNLDFEPTVNLNDLFARLYGFSNDYMHPSMIQSIKYIQLTKGAEENIHDFFLSDELKNIYENKNIHHILKANKKKNSVSTLKY